MSQADYSTRDGIAVVTMSNPPVNGLGHALRTGIVEAVRRAEDIGFPVVLKLNSETLTHKTDVDGVHLNLPDASAVRQAWERIQVGVERYGAPEAFQGVLVKEQDLANTTYRFKLEDGSVIEAKGGDEIEYDGETHTAANLYDALKEGYYGKF